MTDKLNWGILSTAKISKALIEPLRKSKRNTLAAVASRELVRAETFARANKIPRAYGSYEALLVDPSIDVIYNPLPNNLHAEWTIKAVQAGKHVLCEKPLALSIDQVDAMQAEVEKQDKYVVEALMYRSHTQTEKAREIIQGGQLGRLRLVRGSFTYNGTREGNYRFSAEMGGGCLWDVGIYPLSFARFVLGAEPEEVFGWGVTGPTGVDKSFAAQLRFPGDIHLQFDCSMTTPYHVFMEISGEEGTLVIPQPYNPGIHNSLYLSREGKNTIIPVGGTSTYVGEVEAMADSILDGTPPAVSLADSRANVKVIQALFKSAQTGQPVSL
jgi:D-xylose 1-dehydrogenase (NADP+, D-xylono-1,5-lactone-forming)